MFKAAHRSSSPAIKTFTNILIEILEFWIRGKPAVRAFTCISNEIFIVWTRYAQIYTYFKQNIDILKVSKLNIQIATVNR